ncbi:Threonine/homoserine/homoserine lactone efflux protein [Propionispora vibrioides]|uniref:Threonine/homoserine/homoserine lactone efflux protein n=2 Tax=Propionispora vibrioides TaxID=112903 RepID=A0A1H8XMN4_9FIRM|nr:Threonine/homoserine/homoserine lactone efflux protein [Propionispora vibrioides]
MNMEISNIYFFVFVSLILILTPGPTTIYVITKGMTEGRRAAFKALMGASIGDMFQVLAASFGLAALLQASSFAFFIIKMLGAGYLFYIGIRCFLNRQKVFVKTPKVQSKGKSLIFTGFLTSALNPKTTLFFLSFLPQFIDNKSVNAHYQILLFGAVFVIMGFLILNIYALASTKVRSWIEKNEKIQGYFNWVTGLIFIGFGLRLALSERR